MKLNRHQTDKWDDLHRQFFATPTVSSEGGTALASQEKTISQGPLSGHEDVSCVEKVLELELIFFLQSFRE